MEIKLIIWDLDDTLWQGTLAEGDHVCLNEHRAEFIRAFNRCGLVSAICSKNDYKIAQKKLESFQLWDQFIFPRIAFVPKGEVIKKMIEEMQLRPVNVLFIDDNVRNLHEVKSLIPDINIIDATLPTCDVLLQQILDNNKHINKSRIEDYRILQAKIDDRQHQTISNEDFLQASDIHVAFANTLENIEFKERIVELINRSNQLNYTQSRTDIETLTALLLNNIEYECWSVFVWDKYGYYGLVGFAMMKRQGSELIHFVFSCRVMHMGIEHALASKILKRFSNVNFMQLKMPLPVLNNNWPKEVKYLNPDVRTMIRQNEKSIFPKNDAQIKIMYGCMSGGIAFYSRYRDIMDFDGAWFEQAQSYLCFSNLRSHITEVAKQHFPRALVYGAAFDYYNAGWTPDALPLENQSFIDSLCLFCQFFEKKNHKILVVLPPSNMPDNYYRPHDGNTSKRTQLFNEAWHSVISFFPFITLLDLTEFATTEDFPEIAHYYPQFMQKIAHRIDEWYESTVISKPELQLSPDKLISTN